MSSAAAVATPLDVSSSAEPVVAPRPALLARSIAWGNVAVMFAYIVASYLAYWWGWPTLISIGQSAGLVAGNANGAINGGLAAMQVAIYVLALLLAIGYVLRTPGTSLRTDADTISALAGYLVRAAFWGIVLVGVADSVISAARVEGAVAPYVGEKIAIDLGRSAWRGLYIHTPLLVLALVIAAFTRTLGFIWLCLLVVVAEFQIVVSRFIFSYEQGWMGDLVRFWYAALFLLASAYTLREEGHVRVDVVYTGLSPRTKGMINFFGAMFLGIVFCWIILALGTWTRSSVIVGPLISFEVTQSGFGLYIKYLMAGLLGVFAITMLVQFASYMLDALADWRGEPSSRQTSGSSGH